MESTTNANPPVANPNPVVIPKPNPSPADATQILFEAPYEQLLPAFQALNPDEVVAVNIDVPTAVTTVLGVRAQIVQLIPEIQKVIPAFDSSIITDLDKYAMALSWAHTLFSMASQPPNALQDLWMKALSSAARCCRMQMQPPTASSSIRRA